MVEHKLCMHADLCLSLRFPEKNILSSFTRIKTCSVSIVSNEVPLESPQSRDECTGSLSYMLTGSWVLEVIYIHYDHLASSIMK